MSPTVEHAQPLSGKHILVVEDEFYLAMDMKEEIQRTGGNVLGPAPDAAASLSMIEQQRPDCAIVDINLGDGASFEVAEELQRRSIPFVFLTGYDARSIPPELADVPMFEKPADAAVVIQAVTRLTAI